MSIESRFKQQIEYASSFATAVPKVAGGDDTIFSAAANVNGAIVWRARSDSIMAAGSARNGLYAGGDVITAAQNNTVNISVEINTPTFIAAGKDLRFNIGGNETSCIRTCLYTLL